MLPDPRPGTHAIADKHPPPPPNGVRLRRCRAVQRLWLQRLWLPPTSAEGHFYACQPLTGSAIVSSSQPSVSLAALKVGTGRGADSASPKLARLPSAAITSLIFLASSFVGV